MENEKARYGHSDDKGWTNLTGHDAIWGSRNEQNSRNLLFI